MSRVPRRERVMGETGKQLRNYQIKTELTEFFMKKASNRIARKSALASTPVRQERLTLAADIHYEVHPSHDGEAMEQDEGEHQDEKGAKGLGTQGEIEVNQICDVAERDQKW